MNVNRRDFGRLAGTAMVAMLAAREGIAMATDAPTLTIEQRLAPIAHELRPAARQMLESGFPPITAEMLRAMPEGISGPMPELIPAVSVAERDVAPEEALPGVKVFVINSTPGQRRPAILHIHGGGMVVGSARGELRYLQEIAQTLDCVIVSVEYRLSPKVRYSESTEDNYAGLKWLYRHADELGVDRTRIAVMGESAGGGHAALLAIKARDRGEIPLIFQCLVYPMLDDRTGSSVHTPPHIATVGWSPPENRLGWEAFLGMDPGSEGVPAAGAPARVGDLAGLPPAWIGVGGVDLFVNEDIEYARRLTLANVPTELLVIPGAFHGFDRMAGETRLASTFNQSKLDALQRAFAPA